MPNPAQTSRQTALKINNESIARRQEAAPACQYSLAPPTQATGPDGGGLTVSGRQQLLTQPLLSVIVTQYSPATLTVTHCVLAVKPPGPVQA